MGAVTRANRKAQGLCQQCGKNPTDGHSCDSCKLETRERLSVLRNRPEWQQRYRQQRMAQKLQVFSRYGGKCVCCGLSDPTYLSIDHVNGGGNIERKTTGWWKFMRKLVEEPVSSEYQLLCANCHHAKSYNGGCKNHDWRA